MTKKNIIVLLLSTFLVCVAWCGKLNDANVSNIINEENNLKKCQMLCDKEATMYPELASQVKQSCYSNCNEIAALNKRTENNTTTTENTQEETQVNDDDETLSMDDCNQGCRLGVQEIEGCMEACKANILLQTANINDCNKLVELSKDIMSKGTCITIKATEHNKPEWCNLIDETDEKDMCYYSIVEWTKDRTYCNNMTDPETKEYCQTMPLNEE